MALTGKARTAFVVLIFVKIVIMLIIVIGISQNKSDIPPQLVQLNSVDHEIYNQHEQDDEMSTPWKLKTHHLGFLASDEIRPSVAIGLGITSHEHGGREGLPSLPVEKSLFFRTLLPSFCRTASSGYEYRFYLAYDFSDGVYNSEDYRARFAAHFEDVVAGHCVETSDYSLHWVRCEFDRKPEWAQNDAMASAYIHGATYFLRLNDDTELLTPSWTPQLIKALSTLNPPNVGIVAPYATGDVNSFFIHDFTHKTHMDIFGFYYPRIFPAWHGDRFATMIYRPNRAKLVKAVKVKHTRVAKTRYPIVTKRMAYIESKVLRAQELIRNYLSVKHKSITSKKAVVSMSLFNMTSRHVWGAISNAQLISSVFPDWSLRIYASNDTSIHVTKKLVDLGAEVYVVASNKVNLNPVLWKYLVIDDPTVEYFLFRCPNTRLTGSEFELVTQWLTSKYPLHALHGWNMTTNDCLVGGRSKFVRSILGNISVIEHFERISDNDTNYPDFNLYTEIWRKHANQTMVHSTCDVLSLSNTDTKTHSNVTTLVENTVFLGMTFEAFETHFFKANDQALSDEKCVYLRSACNVL